LDGAVRDDASTTVYLDDQGKCLSCGCRPDALEKEVGLNGVDQPIELDDVNVGTGRLSIEPGRAEKGGNQYP
jgi:hypothetical protein